MRMPLARLIVGASLEIMACRNHRAVYISDARIPSVGVGFRESGSLVVRGFSVTWITEWKS